MVAGGEEAGIESWRNQIQASACHFLAVRLGYMINLRLSLTFKVGR